MNVKPNPLLFAALSVALLASFSSLRAEDKLGDTPKETATLDPVIANGTPADALKFDPIIPAYTGKTKGRASTGNVAKEIANDLPFHSSGSLRPGNESGFVGIGKGTEETDVNVLGIPLNRPQGGGSDLATFPQYFWSGYSYQLGPSLGAFDPRGVGGSLTLRLWTQDNLGTENQRATAFHSTRKIQQFSYGRSDKNYAALAGVTTGDVTGPAFAFSANAYESGSTRLSTHFLFSDTKVESFYSEKTPTTQGNQRTDRLIPVLQIDHRLAQGQFLKSSFFYDFTFAEYDIEGVARKKQVKRTHQIGNETAILLGKTRLGIGLRNVAYKRESATAIENIPEEQTLNLQATHTLDFGSLKFEPTLGGTAVTRKGFYPYVSVGLRHETTEDNTHVGEFLRIGFHRRFPSLLDRYYEFSQFIGTKTLVALPNAGLLPENVRSVETGADYAKGDYRTQITAFLRDYKHARYTSVSSAATSPFPTEYYQIQNAGDAYVYGFTHSQDLRALPIFDIGTRMTYQKSRIQDLGAEFPYSPTWVGILKFDLHDTENRYGFEIANKAASQFLSYAESSSDTTRLPAYYYMDISGRARIIADITLFASIEDVFDRKIQYQASTPTEGRVYSVSATANF